MAKVKIELNNWTPWLLRRKAPSTVKVYRWYMLEYLDYCKLRGMNPLKPQSVDTWVGWMINRGLSSSSVNTRFYAVASYFRYIHKDQEIKDIVRPSVRPPPIEIYSMDEAQKVIKRVRTIEAKAVLTIMLINGLRIGEALNMHIDDVLQPQWGVPPSKWQALKSEETFYITVVREKVKEGIDSMRVPTQEEVVEAVQVVMKRREMVGDFREGRWKELKSTKVYSREKRPPRWYIFYSPYSSVGRLLPGAIQSELKWACEDLGILYRSPHKFRHTRATHIIAETGNIALAQQFLGHRRVETTMRYVHMAPELMAKNLPSVDMGHVRPSSKEGEKKEKKKKVMSDDKQR